MVNQVGKRNYTVPFCIPWAPCGHMWSRVGERDSCGPLTFQGTFPVILYKACLVRSHQSPSFSVPVAYRLIWNLFLGDRMWGNVGIIVSGFWQFPWIWTEKKPNTQKCSQFYSACWFSRTLLAGRGNFPFNLEDLLKDQLTIRWINKRKRFIYHHGENHRVIIQYPNGVQKFINPHFRGEGEKRNISNYVLEQ